MIRGWLLFLVLPDWVVFPQGDRGRGGGLVCVYGITSPRGAVGVIVLGGGGSMHMNQASRGSGFRARFRALLGVVSGSDGGGGEGFRDVRTLGRTTCFSSGGVDRMEEGI